MDRDGVERIWRGVEGLSADTEQAFGHLGFTNVLTWADPQRALAGALITSGKPILYRELPDVWALMRRIGIEAPKADRREALSAVAPSSAPAARARLGDRG